MHRHDAPAAAIPADVPADTAPELVSRSWAATHQSPERRPAARNMGLSA